MNQIGSAFGFFRFLAGILCLFGTVPVLFAQVRLQPSPEIAQIGSLNEPLPIDAVIRGSLIASGVSPEDLPGAVEEIRKIVDWAPKPTGDAAADGERLLFWMHENLLSRYVEPQTRLDVLLRSGEYNCVSSAVMYHILVRSRGIAIRGILTTDHAFCRLPDAGGGIDVETTVAFGFDPGTRKEAADSFTGRTGFAYVPPGRYAERREIGDKELISLIYQNRMGALQRRGNWDEAVGLALDRWELAGSEAAKSDFRDSLSNLAADADRRGENAAALTLLARAAAILGSDHKLESAASALLGNAVTRHLRANRTDEALAMLGDPAMTLLVPEDFLRDRRQDAASSILKTAIETEDFAAAADAIDAAFENGTIGRDRWEELMLYLWSGEARRQSAGGDWIRAWNFLNQAPAEHKGIRRWNGLLASYANNAVATYHNRFIDALRQKRWEAAEAVLGEALRNFPGDKTLLSDRQILASQRN